MLPNQFELLKGLPFYDWRDRDDAHKLSQRENLSTSSTFNHFIGLPLKNGHPMPLFDYEQQLFDALQTNKHVWIKKATGLGVTEFMQQYMAWSCFSGSPDVHSDRAPH
jgi:hypothetical protein